MNYYLDTEFIEGFKRPLLSKRKFHSVQLISIGIVSYDNREYYAICNDFNPKDASEWVVENVLKSVFTELLIMDFEEGVNDIPARKAARLGPEDNFTASWKIAADYKINNGTYWNMLPRLLKKFGKSRETIAAEITSFIYDPVLKLYGKDFKTPESCIHWYFDAHPVPEKPKFYGYFSDYDWVVLCSIFGTMQDLPKGLPMFCLDLKQEMETYLLTKEWKRANHPDPDGEHNALVDAKWNRELHDKIIKHYLNPDITEIVSK